MAQYIYGKNIIKQRLKEEAGIKELFVLNNSHQDLVSLAKRQGIKVSFLARPQLDKLVQGNHQGVIAVIEEYKYHELTDIIASIDPDKTPLLVMLDQIQDPHNLGAILRVADAIGVDGVIIKKNQSVGLNATVAKVSAGAIETVKVAQVTNLNDTIRLLKKQGYWICGTGMEDAVDYRQPDYKVPLVVVIGSEGLGISRLVKENCDFLVEIPMLGKINSLNASVATGIILYQVLNQREM